MAHSIFETLSGGDRRSIGNAASVVEQIEAEPSLFGQVIDGLWHSDVLVRMRCADVAEKLSTRHAGWLQPHKSRLLKLASEAPEQELRWHLAQMLPRLRLTAAKRRTAFALMTSYLDDNSRIVAACALQALVELSVGDAKLEAEARARVRRALTSGAPAVRARARKLIARFQGG